ncbi:MAG: transposase [Candidatus Omnitrophica bacterium]|nr:transposase [Candidatus Omnitrophota bacterium]
MREPLETNKVYHVFSRSIAEYKIFLEKFHFLRMKNLLKYYAQLNPPLRFSYFLRMENKKNKRAKEIYEKLETNKQRVNIVAYCIMPTHIHLIIKQLEEKGISSFINDVFNSYTRFFNIKHKRRGPLWDKRFQHVLVESDEQLLHLTRYIHLNPVTAYLTDKPESWDFSSYREYISCEKDKICQFDNLLEVEPNSYKKFVKDRISFQRELANIKRLTLEDSQYHTA